MIRLHTSKPAFLFSFIFIVTSVGVPLLQTSAQAVTDKPVQIVSVRGSESTLNSADTSDDIPDQNVQKQDQDVINLQPVVLPDTEPTITIQPVTSITVPVQNDAPVFSLSIECTNLHYFEGKYIKFRYNNESGKRIELAQSRLTIGSTVLSPYISGSMLSGLQLNQGYVLYHDHTDTATPQGPISYLLPGEHEGMTVITSGYGAVQWSVAMSYQADATTTKTVLGQVNLGVCVNEPDSPDTQPVEPGTEPETAQDPKMSFFEAIQAPEQYLNMDSQTTDAIINKVKSIQKNPNNTNLLLRKAPEEAPAQSSSASSPAQPESTTETSATQKNQESFLIAKEKNRVFTYFFKALQ